MTYVDEIFQRTFLDYNGTAMVCSMKTFSDGLLECAFRRVRRTGKTVFVNRTKYRNAEDLVRELTPDDFSFDDFQTVLYIDYSKYHGVFEVSSADPDFSIKLIDTIAEGNGIFDCEYLINGTQTVHLWHDDFYLVGARRDTRDDPPKELEKQILKLDTFGPFAQNLHLYYNRWEIWRIIFVPDCDIISDEILIDTSQCKAYGHMEGHDLYITTAASKFILPEDMSYAFHGLTRLSEIWGLENLDTSHVTDMSYMFSGCELQYLDLSNFDTSNVCKMNSMFYYSCLHYSSEHEHHVLDLSGFTTSHVTEMDNLFWDSSYDMCRLGDWCFDGLEKDCMIGDNNNNMVFDVRLMACDNLLMFMRLIMEYFDLNLLCNDDQKEWLSSEEMKNIREKYVVRLVDKPDWYDCQ